MLNASTCHNILTIMTTKCSRGGSLSHFSYRELGRLSIDQVAMAPVWRPTMTRILDLPPIWRPNRHEYFLLNPVDSIRYESKKQQKKTANHKISSLSFGAPCWTRTNDLRINSPSLYRLS